MQLASKMRFISAQFEALLTDDLWLTGARHANAMAARLEAQVAELSAVQLLGPPQANSLFAILPPALITELQAWSFFWDWNSSEHSVRWMTNFSTTEDDVDRFAAGVRHFAAQHATR
jgi:threonine aldolase